MKKTKSVIVILLVFSIVLVTQNHIVESESADYIKFYAFTVYSPLNRTYNSEFLVLNLTFNVGMGIRYIACSVDMGIFYKAYKETVSEFNKSIS